MRAHFEGTEAPQLSLQMVERYSDFVGLVQEWFAVRRDQACKEGRLLGGQLEQQIMCGFRVQKLHLQMQTKTFVPRCGPWPTSGTAQGQKKDGTRWDTARLAHSPAMVFSPAKQ